MKSSETILLRNFVKTLEHRFSETAPLMQFAIGPRQVGKTTGVEQFLKTYKKHYHYVLVEKDHDKNPSWLRLQWQKALSISTESLLVIDEVQKISDWAEALKSLWDASRKDNRKIKCLFLGSSSLNLQKGLSESLTGRYEIIQVYHWSFIESKKLIPNLTFDEYLEFGGYPKPYSFLKDKKRLKNYLKESIINNVIEKDILMNNTVKKPALFKQTAEVLASYPSKEISYTKLLGQLQEGGNVELVKYYLNLYESVFLFKQIYKFSGQKSRLSSPKIISLSQGLISSLSSVQLPEGYLFENVVGAELIKHVDELYYWREGEFEVDFVARLDKKHYAIEVKSGRKKHSKSLDVFQKKFKNVSTFIIDKDEYLRLCKQGSQFFISYSKIN